MSKDTFYFSHDYNASMDEKIIKLLKKHGMTGYGVFWRIIENLYNNGNELSLDYDSIAYDLHITDTKIIESVINDFGLFIIKDGFFGSASVARRLDERNEKSEIAREKAYKRWRKDANVSENNATASENDAAASKNDAIYKGKDIKDLKEIKEIFSEKVFFEFEKFLKNEEANKRPVTGERRKALIENLNTIAPDNDDYKIAMINQAVAGNYSDFRPIKDYDKTNIVSRVHSVDYISAPTKEEMIELFAANGHSQTEAEKVYDSCAYGSKWKDKNGVSFIKNWKELIAEKYFKDENLKK